MRAGPPRNPSFHIRYMVIRQQLLHSTIALFVLFGSACAAVPAPEPTPVGVVGDVRPSPAPAATVQPEQAAATITPRPIQLLPTATPGAPAATPVPTAAVGAPVAAAPPDIATAACPGQSPAGARLPGLRGGVNVGDARAAPAQLLDWARGMDTEWVRVDVSWAEIEPQQGGYNWTAIDTLASEARNRGLHLLLALGTPPEWVPLTNGLPTDTAAFSSFAAALAGRAPDVIGAYEIWRSPNVAAPNQRVPTAGAYVELLNAVYTSIKAVDPCALVLNGALEPSTGRDPAQAVDDLAFYRDMLAYKEGLVRNSYDLLAVRLNTSNAAPGQGWDFGDRAASRGFFNHVVGVRDEMLYAGEGQKQIWIVDVGYRLSGEGAISGDQAAEFYRQMLPRTWQFYPWVSAIFPRELTLASDDPWALTDANGAALPPYAALAELYREAQARAEPEQRFAEAGYDLLWETALPRAARLALAPDGAVYAPGDRGWVWAYDPNGAFRRSDRITQRPLIGVVVDQQFNLYASGDDGTLVAKSAGGELHWVIELGSVPIGQLALSPDGATLYASTARERLEAFRTTDGSKLWEADLGGGIPGTPTVGQDGTIYLGATSGGVYALRPDGTIAWSTDIGGWAKDAPLLNANGLTVATDSGAVIGLTLDGGTRWRSELATSTRGFAQGGDGTTYVTTDDARLHALASDGREQWVATIPSSALTAPAVAGDGQIVVGSADGLWAVSANGELRGAFNPGSPITIAPLAGLDGAVYVTADTGDDTSLLAFGPSTLKERYRGR